MIFEEHDLAGAIFIFSEDREIIREMNIAEYQALADGYVPAVDLSNRELQAVYAEINSHYMIRNAVFFYTRFTSRGFIDENCVLPLFELTQNAPNGPNLGAGPIGLVCSSQCPMESAKALLWQPQLDGDMYEFNLLTKAIKRNRIAIHFEESPSISGSHPLPEVNTEQTQQLLEQAISEKLRKEYDRRLREQLGEVAREQQERAAQIMRQREQSIAEVKQQYNTRIQEYRGLLEEQKALLKEARDRNSELSETIDGQAEKIQGLREYFELKLEQMETIDADQLNEMRASQELETSAAVNAATQELKDLLHMREVEILYRNEQESKLSDEIDKLQTENERLQEQSGDRLLSRMLEKGVSFVTYQPGAGHITLPVEEISHYMENPVAYVAKHCNVTEAHYNAWLEHYHVPICHATGPDGEYCGENISRVESPADFVLGESDCCHKHKKTKTPRLKLANTK